MLIISELGLRALLRGMPEGLDLGRTDDPVLAILDDRWTQMRIEGGLEDDFGPDMRFHYCGVYLNHEMFAVDLDELRQLLRWWNENSGYISFGGTK